MDLFAIRLRYFALGVSVGVAVGLVTEWCAGIARFGP